MRLRLDLEMGRRPVDAEWTNAITRVLRRGDERMKVRGRDVIMESEFQVMYYENERKGRKGKQVATRS